MYTYLIISPVEDMDEVLANEFGRNYTDVSCDSWVVASEERTCSAIYEKLDKVVMAEKPENSEHPRLVVVQIHDYYGFHDVALWDNIAVWKRNG